MGWDPEGPGATAEETAQLYDEIERLRNELRRVGDLYDTEDKKAATDIAVLRNALVEFAKPENWIVNGRFDPNGPNFDAISFAEKILALVTE